MIETTPKISVIVPMYNVEKYLKICLTTILNQTFKDFELILIDDCSTDKTLEIAKSFDDSRIKIICNEKNLGVPGLVRNVGIDAAQGKYILFCDADDAILPEELEVFFNVAEKNNADVVNTTMWYVSNDSYFQSLNNLRLRVMRFPPAMPVSSDLKTRLCEEFLLNRVHIIPVIFLYKRKFLLDNDIKFPAEVGDDVFFNFDVVCATSNIIKIERPFYIIRPNLESFSRSPKRLKRNIISLPVLSEHVEKKLAHIQDKNFVQMMITYWVGHVTNSYIVSQYMKFDENGGRGRLKYFGTPLSHALAKTIHLYLHCFSFIFKDVLQCAKIRL